MPFRYTRTAHFADTDAAGVVFFANYLSICHEGYEESLLAAGINLKGFFADTGLVVPIARTDAEFLRPISCGDQIEVSVTPKALGGDSFEIRYEVTRLGPPPKLAARVRTEHVCINSKSRARTPLPAQLAAWVSKG